MKSFLKILVLSVITSSTIALAQAENPVQTGTIDLKFSAVIASPAFTQALAKASEAVNGSKVRMDYKSDHTYRTTKDIITVNVVGKKVDRSGNNAPDLLQKAEFVAVGYNSGWQVKVSEVKVTQITEQEFVEFKE